MDLEVWISVAALLISGLSLAISYWYNRKAAISGRKPVLTFAYDEKSGWVLQNIGNGPALNVIVAQKRAGGHWFNPVRVPPVAKDGAFDCRWLGHANTTGLGVTYTDFEGKPYSSVTGNDLSRVFDGRTLPVWKESEIGRHWDHPTNRNEA